MKKALFVVYGGGHITMAAPVIRELESHGVECQVLALTTGYRKTRQLGLHPLGYRNFLHLVPSLDSVLEWGTQLLSGNQHPDVDPTESKLYLGINFAQWVHDHGEAQAESMYAVLGRRGFFPLHFMDAILRDIKPDIVITSNSPRSEQAAVEAAIGLSIPTLSMVDLFLRPSDPFCQRALYADKLTVISADVKQVLHSIGIPLSRVVVTGNPAFDTLASPVVQQQARDFRQRLRWEGHTVVMFAGHGEDFQDTPIAWRGTRFGIEVGSQLLGWVDQQEDRALIVRYHPSESHLYPQLAQHARVHRSEPSLEPLHPVLLASDVVVVQTSTVGLEASLSGRAVLCLKFAPSVRASSYNYAELGLAQPVDSFPELIRTLDSDKPLRRNDPADYSVGQAGAKVGAVALDLLGA